MLLSLSVHEWAHAWMAMRLGDDTATRLGRLTLNPLAHIDPIGTVLLPLCGVPFGWAKPVPIDPLRFDRSVTMTRGVALVALAGPLSNFALAALSAALLAGVAAVSLAPHPGLVRLLYSCAVINAALGLFNLFPIPPLDGARVAEAFVPEGLRSLWDAYASLGPVMLIAVLLLPGLLGVSLLAWPLDQTRALLDALAR